jgi:hypothetical protein
VPLKKQKDDKVLPMLFYFPNDVHGKMFRDLAAFALEDLSRPISKAGRHVSFAS